MLEIKPGENVLNVQLKPLPPKLEDVDFTFSKGILDSIKLLDVEKKNRILQALNFLYDALAAHTAVQCYLTIYGGLNYLTSGIGRKDNTLLSDATALFKFIESGILEATNARTWMEKLHHFHGTHYNVSKTNRVDKQELDKIKAFFKEFLAKYIAYVRLVGHEQEY